MLRFERRLLLILLMFVTALSARSQVQVSAALCDNRVNPTGIDSRDLFFSWEMQSAKEAVMQSGYQLVIASGLDKLAAGKFDVFDSGLVKSGQSIQVHYSGKVLDPAQTYFWKVKVWDNQNKPSAWSGNQHFTTGIFNTEDWKNAAWIGYEDMPDAQRVVPFVHMRMKPGDPRLLKNAVSPLLRKTFTTKKEVRKALLMISGLGHYEASINGRKVGNAFLAPGWTTYDKTVLYNTYDVSKQVLAGKNTIGVVLGNGFYNISQERYVKGTGAFGNPRMIALLKITYSDGSNEFIVSDKTWKTNPSPITFNTIYGGEDYDARLEQKGWNTNTFDDKTWKDAITVSNPRGKLSPEIDYPVMFMDSLVVKQKTVRETVLVYDFGQNISGIPKIKVRGKAGQTIKIIPAELLGADGKVNQADGVTPHSYSYTLKGDGEETWQPRFSYFAVRYVQIEGADLAGKPGELPAVTDLKLLHNRNSAPVNGSFACSNSLFNRIHGFVDWAIKSNIQSYITDNPQREKLSWQGEQNFMRTAINYNYEMYNLYRSLIQNMADAQHENGLVPDIAPEYIKFDGPFVDSPEWGTTAILDTWFLYRYYGDTAMIGKSYKLMTGYAHFLESRAEDNLITYGLGDWLDIGNVTPKGITATAYYFYAIDALSKMAALTGKKEDAIYYSNLAQKVKTAFNKKFFNPDKKTYGTGSQTAMAMAISMGIVEEQYKKQVLDNLVESIKTTDANRLTAGDVGHKFLVKTLYENGHPETLFAMTNRDDVPGYGYLLKNGATALIETWDGKSSQNQLAMGHILEWFHSGIAGISQEENSIAFKHIKIRPQPVGDITWAKGSFHTPFGWIKTSWKQTAGLFILSTEIPVNATATVYLPANSSSKIYSNGKQVSNFKLENNTAQLEIGSGKYEIQVK